MIRGVVLENFESHKKSEVDFKPGFNVIVGPSDCGKSALLRALYWVLEGKTAGDSYRSHWGGSTRALVELDNGSITRIRDNKFNGYSIGGREFKGFGRAIPEEVQKFVDMNEINFQKQADPFFMLDWSPGKIGEFLNRITNLSVIDRATSEIKSRIAGGERAIKFTRERITERVKELENYSGLEEADAQLSKIEELHERIQRRSDKIDAGESLLRKLTKTESGISELDRTVNGEPDVLLMVDVLERIMKRKSKMKILQRILGDVEDTAEEIQESTREIQLYQSKFKDLMPEECPLCGSEIIDGHAAGAQRPF